MGMDQNDKSMREGLVSLWEMFILMHVQCNTRHLGNRIPVTETVKKVLFVKVWLTFLTIKTSLNNCFAAFCKKQELQTLWLSQFRNQIFVQVFRTCYSLFLKMGLFIQFHSERSRYKGGMAGEWKCKLLIACCTYSEIPLIVNQCFSLK